MKIFVTTERPGVGLQLELVDPGDVCVYRVNLVGDKAREEYFEYCPAQAEEMDQMLELLTMALLVLDDTPEDEDAAKA